MAIYAHLLTIHTNSLCNKKAKLFIDCRSIATFKTHGQQPFYGCGNISPGRAALRPS